jgi:hypothetical protein
VALDQDRRSTPVRSWTPVSDEDVSLHDHALELMSLRAGVDRE